MRWYNFAWHAEHHISSMQRLTVTNTWLCRGPQSISFGGFKVSTTWFCSGLQSSTCLLCRHALYYSEVLFHVQLRWEHLWCPYADCIGFTNAVFVIGAAAADGVDWFIKFLNIRCLGTRRAVSGCFRASACIRIDGRQAWHHLVVLDCPGHYHCDVDDHRILFLLDGNNHDEGDSSLSRLCFHSGGSSVFDSVMTRLHHRCANCFASVYESFVCCC